ncbi:hypothetical protein J5N97_026770 [Dioscorea zingiberensis]|uniref:Uncharacterized protein n=1 Tax=Dioscorea zingiberensis TaxID=325984 RepID=A0A9D5C2T8_9LILI|nr:hypothetical protein J5N97_026770 [Dioscorea zingiberensis]
MASIFRGRRSGEVVDEVDERGAGGKLLRGRRRAAEVSVSPYDRPQRSTAQSQSPRWISGLISGAGKIISSVFGSQSSSPSSSSSSSGYSGKDDASDVSSKELIEQNQEEQNSEVFRNYVEGSLAIVTKSESKLSIEQLLTQETFSRDECDRIMKIIQSRVVDAPSKEVGQYREDENLHKTSGSDIAFQEICQSVDQKMKSKETNQHSTKYVNALSPGYSSLPMHTPDLRATAVKEAKNWFKERKLGSGSKFDLECGPCTLNTDMLQYDIARSGGSPVDVAKTYMRCLPPWQSSPFSGTDFKTPPPYERHLFKDETYHATTNHSLSSSKVLERNYLALGSYNPHVENCNFYLKSTGDVLDIPKSKRDSSERFLEHGNSSILSAADKTGLCLMDWSYDHLKSSVSHAAKTVGCEPGQLDPVDVLFSVENPEVEEPLQMKMQVNTVAASHYSAGQASLPREAGGLSSNAENPLFVANVMPSEEAKHALPSMQINSGLREFLQTNSSQTAKLTSFVEAHSLNDKSHSNGNTQPQNPNGSTEKISANNSSGELNTTLNLVPIRKDVPFANMSEISCEAPTNNPINGSGGGSGSGGGASDLNDGTRMKSIERMLAEPQPNIIRRGKKQVVSRSKRGRGRAS